MHWQQELHQEEDMLQLGRGIAELLTKPMAIYCQGDLGVGKSTLIRSILKTWGVEGAIPSPSYTLIEEYTIADRHCLHLDLYRLQGELSAVAELGLDDYSPHKTYFFVEWAEICPWLPKPDWIITFTFADETRHCQIEAQSDCGKIALQKLSKP